MSTHLELQRILEGSEYLCTHKGSSQYSGAAGSTSSCGLAAMNCVRYALSLEQKGVSGLELLRRLFSREAMQDIMSICSHWTSIAHLEVDDIYESPLFRASQNLVSTQYGRAGRPTFKSMILRLSDITSSREEGDSCALVITRPPEIIACLKVANPSRDVFAIFDSHPRPSHPDGAAFFFCGSIEAAAHHLTRLFPVDARLLDPDSGFQWQAELLGLVSGHFFVCSKNNMRMSRVAEEAFLEATCSILSAKVQEKEALSQCAVLASENERLKKDLELMRDDMNTLRRERVAPNSPPHGGEDGNRNPKNADGSLWKYFPSLASRPGSSRRGASAGTTQGGRQVPCGALDPRDIFVQKVDVHARQLSEPYSRGSLKGKEKPTRVDSEDDFDVALRMQLEFQAEDSELAAQLQYLRVTFAQETFDCSICMDQFPIDAIARLDDCQHTFCRACIRQYITTKLDERKFPVSCPCCAAEDGERKGTVSTALIHQIGISEQAYEVFNELQVAKFSVPIHCRRCDRSAFADKREFEETKVVSCPFPNCSYSWCKDCQQEVTTEANGPNHSCDGGEELNHLMSQQGWKHCPGCKTPTEKTEGCNHMTCGSPGCNTHFCYICGGLIVQSSQRAEINAEVSKHYGANCPLFHVPQES